MKDWRLNGRVRHTLRRHGRARPGHPRLTLSQTDVDARAKPGHDE